MSVGRAVALKEMESRIWIVEFENGTTAEVIADTEEGAITSAYEDGAHNGIGCWGAYRQSDRD